MGTENESDRKNPAHAVLIIGDTGRAEMVPLVGWLKELVRNTHNWLCVPDIAGIAHRIVPDQFPDLIVVLQSWSREFSDSDIHWLFSFAPLARVVVCYGAWCESDGRNHKIWTTAVRVPVWNARSRIEREWRLIQATDHVPPLPWTASREEVFAADHGPITASLTPQRILIDSPDPAYQRFLTERLTEAGHTVTNTNPSLLLFDADPWGTSRATALDEQLRRHPQAVIVAIASLIQPPMESDLRNRRASVILPKLGSWLLEIDRYFLSVEPLGTESIP